MQIFQAQADLEEELPNGFLLERTAHLAAEELSEVAVLAILHHDVELLAIDEGVVVLDDEGVVQFRENDAFVLGFFALSAGEHADIDLLDHIGALVGCGGQQGGRLLPLLRTL